MELKWSERIALTNGGVSTLRDNISGVYKLIYYIPEKNAYYVYYAGQAENLKERLAQHLPNAEIKTCCRKYLQKYECFFRCAIINSQSNRDGVEVFLYNHYKPECVEKVPSVNPISVNL